MRILIIAKQFPPAGTARALQSGKLSVALVAAGAEVVVLAGRASGGSPRAELPAIAIHYIDYYDGSDRHALLRRGYRFLAGVCDVLVGSRWQRKAATLAGQVIDRWSPDIVLSQSVPFDSHRVARKVARKHGLRWAAFLSDPWPPGLLPLPYSKSEFWPLTWLQAREARNVLDAADALVAPTRELLDFMLSRVLRRADVRTFAIPHIGTRVEPNPEEPVILHAGQITRARVSDAALRGLAALAERTRVDGGKLVLLGHTDSAFRRHFDDLERTGAVEFHPHVSADRARDWVSRARVLLVLEADSALSPFMPSKLADYAMSGRPILAISPPGSALRSVAAGMRQVFIAAHDAQEILAAGLAAWDANLEPGSAGPSPFSPESVAARYLDAFQCMLAEPVTSDAMREAASSHP